MAIGTRIRFLRKQLGLSQGQLAGGDMTKSFISQLESGKCGASFNTLEIIASRLGCSADYLLLQTDHSASLEMLLESVQTKLMEDSLEVANQIATQAVVMSALCQQPYLRARAHSLKGQILSLLFEHEMALENLEIALDIHQSSQDKLNATLLFQQMADCCFRAEEPRKAKKFYERTINLSENLKAMDTLRAKCLINLASIEIITGDLHESKSHFQQASKLALLQNSSRLQIQSYLGMGLSHHKLGHANEALRITQEGRKLSLRSERYLLTELEHNMGHYHAARGDWESAFTLWYKCLSDYESRGSKAMQASIYEELASYWLHRDEFERAKQCCKKAFILLGTGNNFLQRGRLYRVLGQISSRMDEPQRADELYQLSVDYFRCAHALEEMNRTISQFQ